MLTRNRRPKRIAPPGTWKLQDAKAHFSEVVRRAQAGSPQRVTVHGKGAVVVVSSDEYARTHPTHPDVRTGTELLAIMQKGRKLGLRLKPTRRYQCPV